MRIAVTIVLLTLLVSAAGQDTDEPDARDIVRNAIDHWRGLSSYSEMTMVIHRPDWERTMTMRAWTKGDKQSLVRVTEPAKDRGNGTLTDDNNMWSFSPKVNRVIKIPSSMMGQSWMGSDFSNKDIARADDIVDQYDHSLLGTEEVDGLTVYEIQAIPHEEAAVVWGREVLRIRSDHVVVEHQFLRPGRRTREEPRVARDRRDGRPHGRQAATHDQGRRTRGVDRDPDEFGRVRDRYPGQHVHALQPA